MRSVATGFFGLALPLFLAGCGGGGGGSSTIPLITSIDYSGTSQIKTYSSGAKEKADPVSALVSWAADHVTKTTINTYPDGSTNQLVTKVLPALDEPTYADDTQVLVTRYGDGYTSSTKNNAVGTPVVTWGSDHITKTTTYRFANGGTNNVLQTVLGTVSGANSSNSNGVVIVSPLITTYGDGFVAVAEDGTSIKPFSQGTLVARNIADPNSYTRSLTRKYDLTWGLKAAPFVMSNSDDVNAQFSSTVKIIDLIGYIYGAYPRYTFNQAFSFSGSLALTTSNLQGIWITPDVRSAWSQGWTGKNVKVAVIDDFTANDSTEFKKIPSSIGCGFINALRISTCSSESSVYLKMTHGDQVSMIVGGSKSQFTGVIYESGSWANSVDIGTYNAAQDLTIEYSSPFYGIAKDASIFRADFLSYQANTNGLFSVLKNWGNGTDAPSILYQSLKVVNLSLGGTSTNPTVNQASYATQLTYANTSVVPDAVFIKAAGNSSCAINLANCDPINPVFHNSPQYKDKSIIVGALNQSGGSIASYSNTAGTYADTFLVADGRGLYNRTTGKYDQGTSFAAPRVAGYVAILRQKFPNLDAVNSSSIMLDTARYDTLTCHPNCDPAIYGRGEASLSRALAPVGYLR